MARPSLEEQARKAVREYLSVAETLAPSEAPLTTVSVATRLNFNRKTLKKYQLDIEIAAAAERQAKNGKPSPKEAERRSMNDLLRDRRREIETMRRRCETLVEQVCLAEGNAQRLGIDPAELWKPLLMPDRTLPHTGRRYRGQ